MFAVKCKWQDENYKENNQQDIILLTKHHYTVSNSWVYLNYKRSFVLTYYKYDWLKSVGLYTEDVIGTEDNYISFTDNLGIITKTMR